ncbi:MAG TPA: hypothetical protein PLG42_05720, partial [Bacteroidales bacterium]|nr:hypothetical protein [Bacteroidales bacterium]
MKKLIILSGFILLIISGCKSRQMQNTEYGSFLYDHKAMPMDTSNSLQYKWNHKEILESVLIDGMESLENWELTF